MHNNSRPWDMAQTLGWWLCFLECVNDAEQAQWRQKSDLLNKRWLLATRLSLIEWHERMCECHHADVIDRYLMLNLFNVDRMGLAKVHDILNTGIQKDAVQIWMSLDYAK